MKAMLCHELTGYQHLKLTELDAPAPGPGEVLVDVEVTALNFFDTLITKGRYQEKPPLPFAPGGEMAGRVNSTGSGVQGFSAGDRVMAYTGWGACQEQIVVKAEQLIKIPDEVDAAAAASLIITYGTAMHGLVDRARLKAGETVAVLGAGGGAGLAAVEISRACGADVIAVASSNEKLALAREKGAERAVNTEKEDLKTALKTITGNKGVDVVYDCVGGELAEPALRAVKWNGRFLVVGFASGDIPAIPLNLIMLKGIHVQGVFLGRFMKEQPEDYKNQISQLLTWVANQTLIPHIGEVFPLEETVKAIGCLAERRAKGKILISMES